MNTNNDSTRWCLFFDGQLLMQKNEGDTADANHTPSDTLCHIPCGERPPFPPADGQTVHRVTLPTGEVVRTFALDHSIVETPRWLMVGLRASFNYLSIDDYQAAGKAAQILYWDAHSRFCPACGTSMQQQTDIMKRCPHCGYEMYPPIAPAIIVLVRRGRDEVLLVHARNFRGTFYGLVAGFLEAGETLEQCVRREVMEETGLSIDNIRYFGSQPWPYPSGIMLGFTADYVGGTIKLQDDELSAGAFYHRDHLPELPQKLSIARKLIDQWLNESEE